MIKKIFRNWKKTTILLVGILVFAFVLRIYHLTLLPVFADEAIYIRWSQVMAVDNTLRFLPLSDGKQPLFMWVLMVIMNQRLDPLFLGRILSVFSGLGTIVAVFGISYSLFKSKKIALIASFWTAICPFIVFFDRIALVDSMLAMFGSWAFFLGIVTAKTKRLDMAMLTGFALGGALLTKSPALFFAIILPLTWVVSKWPRGKKATISHLTQLFGLFLATYAIGYGMYSVLRLGPNSQLVVSRNLDYVFPLSHVLSNPFDPFWFHVKEIFGDWFLKLGLGILVLLFIPGIVDAFKKYKWEVFLLLAWFLFPLIAQAEYAKVFTARYILFTLPPFFVLVTTAFLSKNKLYLKILTAGFILIVVQSLWIDYLFATDPEKAPLPNSERSGYLEEWTAGTGIREVAQYIRGLHDKNPNQQIVVGTEGYFGTLPDGLQIYLDGIPKIVVVGVGLDLNHVPQSLIDSRKSGNPTYLVINSSRFKISNPLGVGLKLIAAYPKALRLDKTSSQYKTLGPQETLYLFEVTGSVVR